MTPTTANQLRNWKPNPGPQTRFLSLTCREALYGGAAGGGKSAALLVDALRYIGRGYGRHYSALLLRRTYPELERSLIRKSFDLYPRFGSKYNSQRHEWTFPGGETIRFGYCERDDDVRIYQSDEYQFIGFDELTHFTRYQYLYLIYTRMRSSVGIPCRARAGTNPGGPGHDWVFERWGPWLDPECPVRAQPGEVIWLQREDDGVSIRVKPHTPGAISCCFVPARLWDNPHIASDGQYETGLNQMDAVTRAQLRDGNWLIKPAKGLYFKRGWFQYSDAGPVDAMRIRFWDRAATQNGDWTVGLLLARTPDGKLYIEDVQRLRGTPGEVQRHILTTASLDGKAVTVGLTEDPGQAGKFEKEHYTKALSGYRFKFLRETGDKVTRAGPISSQVEHGNVTIVDGCWNKAFIEELEDFPEGKYDDQVDALSGAFALIPKHATVKSPLLLYTEPSALSDF